MKRIIALFIIFFFAFPLASMAGEPAWWTQKKRECGVSMPYNDWVSQGSPCNNNSGSGSSGGFSTDATTNIVNGIMNNNSQQLGVGILGAVINGMMSGDKGEAARRQAEEQARAEAERIRAEEELLKKHEEMKQRLLGNMMGVGNSSQVGLMGAGGSSQLGLMGVDSGSSGLSLMTDDLQVRETRGTFGQTELKPIIGDAGTGVKLNSDAEKESAKAGQGFDTAGKIMGADLPAAPVAPATKPVSPAKREKMMAMKTALTKNDDEVKALKALLEKLSQSQKPDEAEVKGLQKKITAKQDEKKEIEKQMRI